MSQSLCFNNFKFSPVTHQNLPWIRSTELAHALGYKREDILGKLYRKNADEFTPDMTQLIEIVDNTGSVFPVKLRIFSLRGCHLLAMFARTPVAKAFRKWVLDVIERYGDRVPVDAQTPPTGTLSRISSRTIAGELHKRHSTVLDAISRAAAVCPQRDAFVRGNYVDAKGQRCPQYMVSREGIIFLSQSYAARQTDAWRNILDTLSSVPEVVTRRPVPQRLPGLPATERLFADIEKALFALDGTENWTHITVRRELSGIGSVPFEVEKAIKHHINAAWYSLGLAQSSLQAALALRKLA
ncbi:BRO family protein [uncultured Bilophila sp.]|uniref:BRO family protein n=1 Tax=uncultured Bilophila sp. TaxID=529385 RepID=UPI002594B81A|nr:BRO family protein [uncultured Bilophila sp.]